MTPEEAQAALDANHEWFNGRYKPALYVAGLHALATVADMDTETDTVQPHPRGGMIGTAENPHYTQLPAGTTVHRHVTEWKKQ